MALDTLKSLNPDVRNFLDDTTTWVKSCAYDEAFVAKGCFKLRMMKENKKVIEITQIAVDSMKHNAHLAQINSRWASVVGLLTLPSFFLSILSLTKGKMVKSRPLAIALGVAGVLFTGIWLMYRNYPQRLAEQALKALEDPTKEDDAIDLIAQGADLSITINEKKAKAILFESAYRKGHVKAFLYLALLEKSDPQVLSTAFTFTQDMAIAKIALELGPAFEHVINANNRIWFEKANWALMCGVPADLILHFAGDLQTAKFAIEAGAKTTNSEAMNELFCYACESTKFGCSPSNEDLANYLKELKVVSPHCKIEDYNHWDNACARHKAGQLSEADALQMGYHPSQLKPTPFEQYLYLKLRQKNFGPDQLTECLKYFGVNTLQVYSTVTRAVQLKDADKLFEDINCGLIRVRKVTCQQILQRLSESVT